MATTTTKTKTKKKMRTRSVAILAGIGVAVVGGGIAFAYFTNVGAGTGSAGTGSNNPVVVVQTSTLTPMGPGIAAQPLSGNFNNPNTGPVFIASVTATVASVTTAQPSPAPSPAVPDCNVNDFLITGTTQGANAWTATSTTGLGVQIPVGTAQGAWSGLTLQFNNKASQNQDACKNSTVTLTYTAK
jgi:flagellar basal body-associated protein FliL